MSISSGRDRTMKYPKGVPADLYDNYGRTRLNCHHIIHPDTRPAPPPKPIGPTPEDVRNYLSDTHCRKLIRDGLLAKDLDEVIAIIEAFGGRREMPISRDLAGSRPDSSSGFGIVMVSIGESVLVGGADRFTDRLIARIRSDLEEKGSFFSGWDYEGPGPFHKASIRIKPEGSGYVVRISVVRDNPEPRLAKAFGLHRRFLRAEHHVTWATTGDDYAIPFDQFSRVARIAGSTSPRPAADVFADLMTPIGDSEYGCAVLHESDAVRVTACIDEVRVPASWKYRNMARDMGLDQTPDDWSPRLVDDPERGPLMVGRANTWREWPNPWSCGVTISIEPRDAMDPEHEAAAIALSNDVSRLWSGLPGAYRDSDA